MDKHVPNIQGIHPLTPMQQGILFHTLLAPEPGVYVVQAVMTLAGDLHASTFQRAWQMVLDRYEVLRSLFVWKGQEKPLQIVLHQVTLPWEELDWRGMSASDQHLKLESFLRADRQRGFTLSKPPLTRLTLIRTAENRYELIWTIHHLLLDGWSTFLVIKDAAAIYRALREGRQVDLPQCRPHRDYISWLQRQDLSKTQDFWRAELKGFTTPTPFTVDRPAAPEKSHGDEVASEQQRWPSELNTALRSFAARQNLTLSTIVHGAWAVLLSRYSGDDCVVFGSVVSGRPAEFAGVISMVGLFINTLPVLARVSPRTSVSAWLTALQGHLVELRQYEHSSLMDVQGWSEVPRDRPLFESLLAFENYPVDASFQQLGAHVEIANIRMIEQTNYPLAVTVVPRDELVVQAAYSVTRFEAATITRLLGHFRTLLENMVLNPNQMISTLSMLTDAERHQLLIEWNKTNTDYPANATIHGLFEDEAKRRPEAVAVEYEGHQLTYGALNARANQVAHHLQRHGIGPETMVGICTERSLETIVGILGILKAGGAYVPLDPDYPPPRLAFMLHDTAAPVLLTQGRLRDQFSEYTGQVIALDADWQDIAQEREADPNVQVSPQNLAYVIYTSGSTGHPKGTCIEHRSVVRLVKTTNYVELGPQETFLQYAALSFDASTFELWGSLLNGAKLVVCPAGVLSLEELAMVIQKRGVTTLWLTAALFHLMVDEQIHSLRGVRQLLAGGETLSVAHVRRMLGVIGESRLINGYGPTENTTFTCCHIMTKGSRIEQTVPIGRPISNSRVYVLDRHMQPVPVGVYGELYIGGDGLAREYLHQPELSAEKFVKDPFSADVAARLYRSGDRVRFRVDGCIEFLGRVDNQVKIRGFRIELGEIETILDRHPAVRQSVVVVREEEPGEKQLVAYVVLEPSALVQTHELRQYIKESLPDFMLPSTIVQLEALPLTPNGKIDRNALPAPTQSLEVAKESGAPRDPLEHALVRIWSKILRVNRVGLHDEFFELGGHSLAAVRVVSEVEKLTGKSLPLATFFHASTVAAFADILRRQGWAPSWSSLVPIQPLGSRSPLFLVHSAWGNVLLYRQMTSYLGPDQPVYGLQSQGLNGDGHFNSTVEEMASHYIKEVITVQPHGPYFLSGYCSGGIVALEMAQQLIALGEKVENVILLDTYNLNVVPRSRGFLHVPIYFLQNVWFHCANGLSIRGEDRRKFLSKKADIAFTRLGIALRAASNVFRRLSSSETHHRRSQLALKRTNDQAAYRYVPRPYRGRVTLIRSKGDFSGFTSPSFGWSHVVCGNLVIHELPVYPKGMLIEPFCRLLADTLTTCLDSKDVPSSAAA